MHLCDDSDSRRPGPLRDGPIAGKRLSRNDLRAKRRPAGRRSGTTLVEFAVVFPIFMVFIFALFEFSHVLMVMNMLTAVAKEAAHKGAFDGAGTSDVQTLINSRMNNIAPGSSFATHVKDASVFELSTTDAASVNVASLPNIDLAATESRHPFIVKIELPYDDVALLPPFWAKNITLNGAAIMRRE